MARNASTARRHHAKDFETISRETALRKIHADLAAILRKSAGKSRPPARRRGATLAGDLNLDAPAPRRYVLNVRKGGR